MSKYYVLEKHMSDEQGLTIRSPFDYFSESVHQCEELGEEPFIFSNLEEAKECKKGLELIFKGRTSHNNFIILTELEE